MKRSTGLVNKLGGSSLNLTLNPSFTTDTTGWTATDATLASVTSTLEITESGGINPGKAYQDISTIIGRLYKLSFKFKKGTSATGSLKIGTTTVEDELYDSGALNDAIFTQYDNVYFIANESTTRITLQSDSTIAGETSYFDDVLLHCIYNGFADIFKNCKINFYTGTQPANADDAATGTLLWTVTKDGDGVTGLTFEESVSGKVYKNIDEVWKGTVLVSGTVGWFRVYEEGDDPLLSSSINARIDGTCGITGADLNMTTLTALVGAVKEFTNFGYIQSKG